MGVIRFARTTIALCASVLVNIASYILCIPPFVASIRVIRGEASEQSSLLFIIPTSSCISLGLGCTTVLICYLYLVLCYRKDKLTHNLQTRIFQLKLMTRTGQATWFTFTAILILLLSSTGEIPIIRCLFALLVPCSINLIGQSITQQKLSKRMSLLLGKIENL